MRIHEEVQALLVDYLSDEVSKSEREFVQKHLSGCAECQKEFDDLNRFRDRLKQQLNISATQTSPSDEVWTRIATQTGENTMSLRTLSFSRQRWAVAAVAALIVIAVHLALRLRRRKAATKNIDIAS